MIGVVAALVVSGWTGPRAAVQFSSGVNVVEVYATATDAAGRVVSDLEAGDFRVSENGRPQRISVFSAGEFPLSVAIGLDHSFSMAGERLSNARAGARAFLGALRAEDEVAVLAIGSGVQVVAALSTDHPRAGSVIDQLGAWGTTPLYDATLEAVDVIQGASGRRALVLFSDGDDRYSEAAGATVIETARRRDVLIYPVTLARKGSPVLDELAAVTGGRSFLAKDRRESASAGETIARELRFQYLLGYTPGDATAPGWRSIAVTVQRPGVRVRARAGYQSR